MIDTIRAYVQLFEIGLTKNQLIEQLKPLAREIFSKDGGNSITLLGNKSLHFSFTVTDTTLRMGGSLCKFYKGDNVQTLQYHEVDKAISKLTNLTGLPVDMFYVSRLDLAENISTQEPATRYIDMFEGIDRYQTEIYRTRGKYTGKYFIQSGREVLLYDKFTEHTIRKKGNKNGRLCTVNSYSPAESHDFFKKNGKNVFRYELRLKKRLKEQLGLSQVRVSDLGVLKTWRRMIRLWFIYFMKMSWRNEISVLPSHVKQGKAFANLIYRVGIEGLGGQFAVKKMIRTASKRKQFDNKSQGTRLIKKVEHIVASIDLNKFTNQTPYLEIRQKILAKARFHLHLT